MDRDRRAGSGWPNFDRLPVHSVAELRAAAAANPMQEGHAGAPGAVAFKLNLTQDLPDSARLVVSEVSNGREAKLPKNPSNSPGFVHVGRLEKREHHSIGHPTLPGLAEVRIFDLFLDRRLADRRKGQRRRPERRSGKERQNSI